MGEELADAFGNDPAGKPLRLGVNGLKGDALHLCIGAHLRVDHLAAEHPAGDDALKIVFLPDGQFLGHIGVVEPGDLQPGHVIPGGDALHPSSAGQDAPAGLGEHFRLDHALGVGGGLGDGIGLGEIDIPAGVVAQQVGQRHDAQLLEPLSGLGAYPFQVAHRRVRHQGRMKFWFCGHGGRSFHKDSSIVAWGREGCNKTKNPERFHVQDPFGGDDQI